MHLLDRIDQWGRRAAGRAAHVSAGRAMSWEELVGRSDALAVQLAEMLPGNRAPIAVVGHKESEMLVGFLGCVKSGHPYVPIDISIPKERQEKIAAIAEAPVVLNAQKIAEMAPAEASGTRPDPSLRVGGNDPYYIIFTSGSTGEPKGVVITLACLESFVDWILDEQKPAEAGEIFLNQAPFSFDLSVMDLYASLATGGTLFSITRDEIGNLRKLFAALGASGTTFWVSTPSFAQMCLVEKRFSQSMLPGMRRFWFCGEILPADVAAGLLERFPQAEVWNTYGPTEATVATTSIRIDAAMARQSPLPVGYEKPGTTVICMTENKRPAPDGERGEIVIAGPNVSPGYLARPDLTGKAFFKLDGVQAYRTGDWGRVKNGLVFFEGRMDAQIKLHGYRIELGDVEANLRAISGVYDAVILAEMKNEMATSLVAFVALAKKPAEDEEFKTALALKEELARKLPAYMVPRTVVFMESLPMTPNGKADRRKLAEILQRERA